MVNIADLDHAQVLAALYNHAKVQARAAVWANLQEMSPEEAQGHLDDSESKYFDYLRGRVLKIRIEDELDTWLYNRDNGEGAAERVIAQLRGQQ